MNTILDAYFTGAEKHFPRLNRLEVFGEQSPTNVALATYMYGFVFFGALGLFSSNHVRAKIVAFPFGKQRRCED